jgi:hypothetical protein
LSFSLRRDGEAIIAGPGKGCNGRDVWWQIVTKSVPDPKRGAALRSSMITRWSPRVSRIISSQNDFELAGFDASVAEALTMIESKCPQVVLID